MVCAVLVGNTYPVIEPAPVELLPDALLALLLHTRQRLGSRWADDRLTPLSPLAAVTGQVTVRMGGDSVNGYGTVDGSVLRTLSQLTRAIPSARAGVALVLTERVRWVGSSAVLAPLRQNGDGVAS